MYVNLDADEEQPCEITKFVVLGHGRTGSTMLSLALGNHPGIRMYLELFHDDQRERETSFRADKRAYRNGEDAINFLRQAVFYPRYWKPLKAVGFKLFYDHARKDEQAKKVWRYLEKTKDVHIVHLMRRNLFESWISYQTALRTDVWTIMEKTPHLVKTIEPFELDVSDCQEFFKNTEREREKVRKVFKSHPFIEVEYERDLCRNFAATVRTIQDFLGVPRRSARMLTQKQRRLSPRQQISNYDELKNHFAGTAYEEFFDF